MKGRFVWIASGAVLLAGSVLSTADARSYSHRHHGYRHHHRHHVVRTDGEQPAAGGAVGRGQSGLATWYGPGFHGRKTASGERFNTGALTAAHRSLPFGTQVKVTNVSTGRSVVVRINDRGPFGHGAVIDLSRASASAIGMGGTARVSLARLN